MFELHFDADPFRFPFFYMYISFIDYKVLQNSIVQLVT